MSRTIRYTTVDVSAALVEEIVKLAPGTIEYDKFPRVPPFVLL